MEIIFGINNLKKDLTGSVVTIGNFDGLHKGHKEIIKKVIVDSKERNTKSVAFTFFPHPQTLFNKEFKIISTLEQKVDYFKETGIDYLIIEPFTKEFRASNPQLFIESMIIDKLKSSKVIIGYDFAFGRKGKGNAELLRQYPDFETEVISPISVGEMVVHSTLLRNCLVLGDTKLYKKLSGKYPKITGHVVSGKGVGNKMGFATANINFPANIIKPARGVYLVRAKVKEIATYGIANIGKKPTMGINRFNAEIHLFDFAGNIYGEKLAVELLSYLRPEKKFESIEQLIDQVQNDILQAKEQLNSL